MALVALGGQALGLFSWQRTTEGNPADQPGDTVAADPNGPGGVPLEPKVPTYAEMIERFPGLSIIQADWAKARITLERDCLGIPETLCVDFPEAASGDEIVIETSVETKVQAYAFDVSGQKDGFVVKRVEVALQMDPTHWALLIVPATAWPSLETAENGVETKVFPPGVVLRYPATAGGSGSDLAISVYEGETEATAMPAPWPEGYVVKVPTYAEIAERFPGLPSIQADWANARFSFGEASIPVPGGVLVVEFPKAAAGDEIIVETSAETRVEASFVKCYPESESFVCLDWMIDETNTFSLSELPPALWPSLSPEHNWETETVPPGVVVRLPATGGLTLWITGPDGRMVSLLEGE